MKTKPAKRTFCFSWKIQFNSVQNMKHPSTKMRFHIINLVTSGDEIEPKLWKRKKNRKRVKSLDRGSEKFTNDSNEIYLITTSFFLHFFIHILLFETRTSRIFTERENHFLCYFTREFVRGWITFFWWKQRHDEDKKKKKEIYNRILFNLNFSKHVVGEDH